MASEERAHRRPLGSRPLPVDQAHLPVPLPRRRFEILLHDGNNVPRREGVGGRCFSSTGTRVRGAPGISGRVTAEGKGRTSPGTATGAAGRRRGARSGSSLRSRAAPRRGSSRRRPRPPRCRERGIRHLPDFGEGVRVGAGRVVRPVGGQRVVDVDHGEEPRPERDLGAFQLPGVPRPVVPLMVGQDDLGRAVAGIRSSAASAAPTSGWLRITTHSSWDSGPGFSSTLSGMPICPHVVEEGAAPGSRRACPCPGPPPPAPGRSV